MWYAFYVARLDINKKQNFFLLPDHQLSEILILAFYEGTKKE